MEVDIKHNIAQNIRNFRKAKGLTQKQLGYYPKYQRILIDFTAFFQFCGNRVVTGHKKSPRQG